MKPWERSATSQSPPKTRSSLPSSSRRRSAWRRSRAATATSRARCTSPTATSTSPSSAGSAPRKRPTPIPTATASTTSACTSRTSRARKRRRARPAPFPSRRRRSTSPSSPATPSTSRRSSQLAGVKFDLSGHGWASRREGKIALEATGVRKIYTQGRPRDAGARRRALRRARGRVHHHHRPERLRQEHLPAHHGRLHPGRRRHHPRLRQARSTAPAPTAA